MTTALRTFSYRTTTERPSVTYWYRVNRELVDFSEGFTFELKVKTLDGTETLITKSDGITGAAGGGMEGDGTPNITIEWEAGELAALDGGTTYRAVLTPTLTDGLLDYEPVEFFLEMRAAP